MCTPKGSTNRPICPTEEEGWVGKVFWGAIVQFLFLVSNQIPTALTFWLLSFILGGGGES